MSVAGERDQRQENSQNASTSRDTMGSPSVNGKSYGVHFMFKGAT